MAFDRSAAAAWYRRNRARSRDIFDLLTEQTYYSRPIALRHPIVFYEGHLPGFSFNTLVKRGLGRPSIDASLEALFARGIDPHESAGSGAREPVSSPEAPTGADIRARWPTRETVRQFAADADRHALEPLQHDDL